MPFQTKDYFFLPGKPIWKKNVHRASVKWNTTGKYNLLFLLVKLQTFSIAFPFRLLLYCQKIGYQLFTFSYFSIMTTMPLFYEF